LHKNLVSDLGILVSHFSKPTSYPGRLGSHRNFLYWSIIESFLLGFEEMHMIYKYLFSSEFSTV